MDMGCCNSEFHALCDRQTTGVASREIGKSGNDINVSISMNGSDTPVTRPETDKAGLSSRDRGVASG